MKAIARGCAFLLMLVSLAACQYGTATPEAGGGQASLPQAGEGAADGLGVGGSSAVKGTAAPRIHALRIPFAWQNPGLTAGARRDLGLVAQQLQSHEDMRVELLASIHGRSYPQSRAEAESLRFALMVRQHLFERGVPVARVGIRALGHGASGDQNASKAQAGRVDVMLQAGSAAALAPVHFAWWYGAGKTFLSDPDVYPNMGRAVAEQIKSRALDGLPYKSDRNMRPAPGPSTALRG